MSRRAAGKSAAHMILALIIIFGTGAAFVAGIGVYRALRVPGTASAREVMMNRKGEVPEDLPVFRGAKLAESKQTDNRVTAKYLVPLGSVEQVREFYRGEMKNKGWQEYTASATILGFYKNENGSRVQYSFNYYGGKTVVIASIIE